MISSDSPCSSLPLLAGVPWRGVNEKEKRAQKVLKHGVMVVREGRDKGGDQKKGPKFPREGYQGRCLLPPQRRKGVQSTKGWGRQAALRCEIGFQ